MMDDIEPLCNEVLDIQLTSPKTSGYIECSDIESRSNVDGSICDKRNLKCRECYVLKYLKHRATLKQIKESTYLGRCAI